LRIGPTIPAWLVQSISVPAGAEGTADVCGPVEGATGSGARDGAGAPEGAGAREAEGTFEGAGARELLRETGGAGAGVRLDVRVRELEGASGPKEGSGSMEGKRGPKEGFGLMEGKRGPKEGRTMGFGSGERRS
jgi:hypothetical protein